MALPGRPARAAPAPLRARAELRGHRRPARHERGGGAREGPGGADRDRRRRSRRRGRAHRLPARPGRPDRPRRRRPLPPERPRGARAGDQDRGRGCGRSPPPRACRSSRSRAASASRAAVPAAGRAADAGPRDGAARARPDGASAGNRQTRADRGHRGAAASSSSSSSSRSPASSGAATTTSPRPSRDAATTTGADGSTTTAAGRRARDRVELKPVGGSGVAGTVDFGIAERQPALRRRQLDGLDPQRPAGRRGYFIWLMIGEAGGYPLSQPAQPDRRTAASRGGSPSPPRSPPRSPARRRTVQHLALLDPRAGEGGPERGRGAGARSSASPAISLADGEIPRRPRAGAEPQPSSLPGFMIPAGSSRSLTARSASSPSSPTSPRM